MIVHFRKSESAVSPKELEISDKIFVRKNITSEERTRIDGNKTTFYLYDEAEMSSDEYEEYISTMESPDRKELMKVLNQIQLQLDTLGG